jgi:hypothetical protein
MLHQVCKASISGRLVGAFVQWSYAGKAMPMSKVEIIDKLRAGWRASGNYEKPADFDLVSPTYAGTTPRVLVPAPIIRELVQEGVLRRPAVGLGKAFMDSVKPIST